MQHKAHFISIKTDEPRSAYEAHCANPLLIILIFLLSFLYFSMECRISHNVSRKFKASGCPFYLVLGRAIKAGDFESEKKRVKEYL